MTLLMMELFVMYVNPYNGADINRDGAVNPNDLRILTKDWLRDFYQLPIDD